MPIKSIASLLAKTLREARGAQLSVGTMIGGYDLTKNQPQLFYVDNDGNPNILEDKSGFPIIYDPAPDFQKLVTEQIDSPEFKDQQTLLQEERIETLNKEILMKTGTKRRYERRKNPPKKEDKEREDTGFSYLDVDETDLKGTAKENNPKIKLSNQGTKNRKLRRENNE